MLSVKSVTGATLQVEMTDLSGQQLMIGEGGYKGEKITVVGITPQFRVASLVVQLKTGKFMAINPDHLVGYNGGDNDLYEVL